MEELERNEGEEEVDALEEAKKERTEARVKNKIGAAAEEERIEEGEEEGKEEEEEDEEGEVEEGERKELVGSSELWRWRRFDSINKKVRSISSSITFLYT